MRKLQKVQIMRKLYKITKIIRKYDKMTKIFAKIIENDQIMRNY